MCSQFLKSYKYLIHFKIKNLIVLFNKKEALSFLFTQITLYIRKILFFLFIFKSVIFFSLFRLTRPCGLCYYIQVDTEISFLQVF